LGGVSHPVRKPRCVAALACIPHDHLIRRGFRLWPRIRRAGSHDEQGATVFGVENCAYKQFTPVINNVIESWRKEISFDEIYNYKIQYGRYGEVLYDPVFRKTCSVHTRIVDSKFVTQCFLESDRFFCDMLLKFPLYLDMLMISITGEEFPKDIVSIDDKYRFLLLCHGDYLEDNTFRSIIAMSLRTKSISLSNAAYIAKQRIQRHTTDIMSEELSKLKKVHNEKI